MPNKFKFSSEYHNGILSKGNIKIANGNIIAGPTHSTGFYNGITPPVNGYTIYMNKGESIVESGLTLYLDAGNYTSYNPAISGSTWYDLSGNGNDAYGDPNTGGSGYNNNYFPIWQSNNGGRFYFDGTKGLTILTDMGSHTELTADFWMYKSNNDTVYLFDARNDGGPWWLLNYSSHNINAYNNLTADDPLSYQSNSNWWNKWIHVVITSDSSGSSLWINGENINDSRLKSSTSLNENLGQYFRIGNRYTSSSRYTGYFSIISFYNRVLSSSEIQQNYNANKKRFGL